MNISDSKEGMMSKPEKEGMMSNEENAKKLLKDKWGHSFGYDVILRVASYLDQKDAEHKAEMADSYELHLKQCTELIEHKARIKQLEDALEWFTTCDDKINDKYIDRIVKLEDALKRVFDCCNPMYHETESEIRIKAIIRQALKGGEDE